MKLRKDDIVCKDELLNRISASSCLRVSHSPIAKNMSNIRSYRELRVYQNAFESAMKIFEITKNFPAEEKYSMVDQMRRSSRSVCANLAEAWRKRRYSAHFVSKLQIVKAKPKKQAFGLNSHFVVNTLTKIFSMNSIPIMI